MILVMMMMKSLKENYTKEVCPFMAEKVSGKTSHDKILHFFLQISFEAWKKGM